MHPDHHIMPALDATLNTLAPRKPQLEMANFCHKQLAEVLDRLEKMKGDVNGKGSGRKLTLADLTVPDPVTKEEIEEELLGGDYVVPNFGPSHLVPATTKQVDDGVLDDEGYELVDQALSDTTDTLSDAGLHQPPPPPPAVLSETKGLLTAETLAKRRPMTYNVRQWARSHSSGPGSVGAPLPQESMFLPERARPAKTAKVEELPEYDSDPPSSHGPSSCSSQGYVPVHEKKQVDVDLMCAGGRFDPPTKNPARVDVPHDDIDLEPKKNSPKMGKAHK